MRRAGWLMAVAAVGCAAPAAARLTQPELDRLAAGMGYRVEIVDNDPKSCPSGISGCFLSRLTLTVPETLPATTDDDGLALYFSFVNPLPLVESDAFRHQWINGDLQRLVLRPGTRLVPGRRYVVELWGQGAHFSAAHVMPNAYLVADGLAARTIAASRSAVDPETGLETLPFVAPMTDEAKLAAKGPDDATRWLTAERAFALQAGRLAPPLARGAVAILPRPAKAERPAGAALDLSRGLAPRVSGVSRAALAPALAALAGAGVRLGGGAPLTIRVDRVAALPAEGYRLTVDAGGVAILARDAAGAGYALRSLAQQAAFDGRAMSPLRVEDAPRYGFRGLHIDLGRNFHDRAELLKLVEAAAEYKLNRLHLHLADDEGWRIEIAGLPELTAIGSRRCHDPVERRCLQPQLGGGAEGGPGDGYLTRADYLAVVRAAAARGITVIPSIDMPGHSRAAIRAMEARHGRLAAAGRTAEAARYRLVDPADTTAYRSIQNYTDNTLNVCLPATYRFVDHVVAEIAAMHRAAGQPLATFHLGADETAGAWKDSPACRAMIAANGGDATRLTPRFIERVAASLKARGIVTAGWSDGLGHTETAAMPRAVQTNIWGVLHTGAVREAHDQANRGWDAVLSIPDLGYLDMPYAPHPREWGYDWASRGVDTHQVWAFMPGNLPANAALIVDTHAKPHPVADAPVLAPGRGMAGLQAQLWSETIRSDAMVEYMLFPRLLALAERAWSPAGAWEPAYRPGAAWAWQDPRIDRAALDAGWRDFAGRLAAQLPRLGKTGIAYRLAPPGARIADGRLEANTELPGTPIEYRTGGSDWRPYTQPVAVSGPVELRTRTPDGARASRTVTVGSPR